MELSKSSRNYILLNLILFLSFSISVNSYQEISNIILVFYILFHLTFIYLLFYHFHFFIYIIGFVYGILLDIFLLNEIGVHLITFLLLIFLYNIIKKYLFQLSSKQIIITIFITLVSVLYLEIIMAHFLNQYFINFMYVFKLLIISLIIFIPSIFLLTKVDK